MGKIEMIEKWFYSYSDDVYNFCIYYTGSKDVEDFVQEVFLRALKSIDQFEDKANPKTWLIAIARNLVIDNRRRAKLIKFLPIEFFGNGNLVLNEKTIPENIILHDEVLSEIYETIHSLKTSYKDVLILRLIMELSVEESSRILNWSPAKVSVTHFRALNALKKRLEKENERRKAL